MKLSCNLSLLLVVLQSQLYLVHASPGDKLKDFKACILHCEQASCHNDPYYGSEGLHNKSLKKRNRKTGRYGSRWNFDTSLPTFLRLLLWDCKSNCDYQCQRLITKERIERGEEIYQFHGKWPFRRVLGIQELFSVLFSVMNFIPHYLGYIKVHNSMKSNTTQHYLLNSSLRNIKFIALVTMCAWVFSAIFHMRDFILTERLDYYFAGLTVLSGLYVIGFRFFRLYLPSRKVSAWFWTVLCIGAYTGHVMRLVYDWSYTYNMRANIFVGVLQNIIWALTCFSLYSKFYQRENGETQIVRLTHLKYVKPNRIILGSFFTKSEKLYSLYPLFLCGIVAMGMSLEIFDFAPIFFDLIDAHSLWHLVTVFPAFFGWYDWMLWDVNENVSEDLANIVDKKEQ